MLSFLKINHIPIKTWSSESPLNFKPKYKTLLFLSLGLFCFGLGETGVVTMIHLKKDGGIWRTEMGETLHK